MPPCLTLSIIRNISRVKWGNPRKGVAPPLHLGVVAIEKSLYLLTLYLEKAVFELNCNQKKKKIISPISRQGWKPPPQRVTLLSKKKKKSVLGMTQNCIKYQMVRIQFCGSGEDGAYLHCDYSHFHSKPESAWVLSIGKKKCLLYLMRILDII